MQEQPTSSSRRRSPAERFWSFVAVGKPDECWEWFGGKTRGGYGTFSAVKGKLVRTHRMSWALAHGPIPDGLMVLHRCDNPPCVNPAHLFLGTHADNMADMDAKGRRRVVPAEQRYNAKLSDAQVTEIRTRYAAGGVSGNALAREYGVSSAWVSDIIRHAARRTGDEPPLPVTVAKRCPHCEVEFQGSRKQTYCSPRCAYTARARRRGVKPKRRAQHGTASKYNLGCRCDDCRAASNVARKDRARRAAARAAA